MLTIKISFPLHSVDGRNHLYIAANVRAFCCAGILWSVSLEQKPNRITEVEVTICSWDLFGQPELQLGSDRDDENLSVIQHSRKPSVVRSFLLAKNLLLLRRFRMSQISVIPLSLCNPDTISKKSTLCINNFSSASFQ